MATTEQIRLAKDSTKKKTGLSKEQKQRRALRGEFGLKDMQVAQGIIDKFLPGGSLGRIQSGYITTKDKFGNDVPVLDAQGNPQRIGENQQVLDMYKNALGRPGETQELLSRYKDIADQGYGSQEFQGLREQMTRGLDSNLQTQQIDLAKAQSRGRVYGAAAGAQAQNLQRSDLENRGNVEQQLFLKGEEMKRGALDKYSGALTQAQQDEVNRRNEYAGTLSGMQKYEREGEKFNAGQNAAERAGQMAGYMGTLGMLRGDRFTKEQLALSKLAIEKAGSAMTSIGNDDNPNDAKRVAIQAKINELMKDPAKNKDEIARLQAQLEVLS